MTDASLEWFLTTLAEFNANSQNAFDPVRLAYFDSLATRLAEHRHANNLVLIESACNSLRQYQTEFEERQRVAKETVDLVAANFPDQLDAVQRSYELAELRTLQQLKAVLQQPATEDQASFGLRELIASINQDQCEQSESAQPSFDDVLKAQEASALDKVSAWSAGNGESQPDGSGEQLELQSMKAFRESVKYFDIDQLINRAINECPENPGPHNPQMLAVKALMQMRDLSPQYLRRFAGYVETMLWLEKNSAKLSNTKPNM